MVALRPSRLLRVHDVAGEFHHVCTTHPSMSGLTVSLKMCSWSLSMKYTLSNVKLLFWPSTIWGSPGGLGVHGENCHCTRTDVIEGRKYVMMTAIHRVASKQ